MELELAVLVGAAAGVSVAVAFLLSGTLPLLGTAPEPVLAAIFAAAGTGPFAGAFGLAAAAVAVAGLVALVVEVEPEAGFAAMSVLWCRVEGWRVMGHEFWINVGISV